jgi:long-chain fatty acid transport protein
VTLRAGLGAEIGWGVRVGVGLAVLAEVRGAVNTSADATGRVDTRVDDQLVATYAPAIGVTFEPPHSKLRLGATFRGALDARFDVLVDATKLSTLPIPRFDIAGVAAYDPAQIAVEIAHLEPLSGLGAGQPLRVSSVLAAQFVYKRWRDFDGFLEPTVVCSEGAPGSCGLVPPTIAWRDTFAVRVGAEEGFELAPGVVLHGRGGAFVETSALPSDLPASDAFDVPTKTTVRVPTRYFDASRLALTTGAGVSIADPLPLTVDLFLQYHVLLPRTVTAYDVSGHVKVVGLALGVEL